MESHYLLDQPLPTELQPTQRSSYFRYPVFSWQWYWRRAAIYGPFLAFIGAAIAARTGLDTNNWALAAQFAGRTVPAWVFIGLMGPLFCVLVRQRHLSPTRERNGLIAVVLIAIVGSFLAKAWYENYYTEIVSPVLVAMGKGSRQLPGMLLNSIETLRLSDQLFDWFYKFFFGFLILTLSGGYGLLMYFREIRALESYRANQEMLGMRQQRDEADRRLLVLQAQVEPHFLYNTLASVRSLVRLDPERAESTIDALVDHLRATLPKFREGHNAHAMLGEQVEICRSYLEVMRIRMGARLTYTVDIAPELAQLPFPPLMLISLIENAIKHGVEPKPGPCAIQIAARRVTGNMEVTVSDDGVGLQEGPSGGLGLANIRAQLAARYDKRASLELRSGEQNGTVARLIIPIEKLA